MNLKKTTLLLITLFACTFLSIAFYFYNREGITEVHFYQIAILTILGHQIGFLLVKNLFKAKTT